MFSYSYRLFINFKKIIIYYIYSDNSYTVNVGNSILYLLYFTCEESDRSNQLRVQLSSHVTNITNQHLEWNHQANQSKALKWLPRCTVSKSVPARSLCLENMASASRFVPLELPLDEFVEEQSNKNTSSKTNRDIYLLKEFF